MKGTAFAIFAALALSASAVCAQPVSRTIHGAAGYKSVTVKSSIDLVFDERFTDSIYIEAPAELMEKLALEYKGTSVTATYKKASKKLINESPRAVVYLSAKWLESLSVSGDSDIEVAQQLTGKKLSVALDGDCRMNAAINASAVSVSLHHGAQLNCTLVCSQLSVSQKGSSRFEAASGRCGKLSLTASGDSSFDGYHIEEIKSAKCNLSGNAKANIRAVGDAGITVSDSALATGWMQCNKLTVNMTKSSNVVLSGTSKILTLKTGDKCYFRNRDFEAVGSAKCQISGNGSADINCRGNVYIKATDAANVTVPHCGGKLKIDARGTSSVSYVKGTRMDSILIKDQATTSYLNPASLQGWAEPVRK